MPGPAMLVCGNNSSQGMLRMVELCLRRCVLLTRTLCVTEAVLRRARHERERNRTRERALLALQQVVEATEQPLPPPAQRLRWPADAHACLQLCALQMRSHRTTCRALPWCKLCRTLMGSGNQVSQKWLSWKPIRMGSSFSRESLTALSEKRFISLVLALLLAGKIHEISMAVAGSDAVTTCLCDRSSTN